VPIVLKSGSLNLLEPSGPVQACNGIALLLPNIADEMSLENQNHEEARTNPVTLVFLFSRLAIFVTFVTGSYPASYKRITKPADPVMLLNFLR
jgi:hypothetical protein